MSDRVVNLPSFPTVTEAELHAPVSVKELKAAWPYCRDMARQKYGGRSLPEHRTSLPLAMRCGFLVEFLSAAEPTEEQFAAMAQMPLDGSVSREEILKRLGV